MGVRKRARITYIRRLYAVRDRNLAMAKTLTMTRYDQWANGILKNPGEFQRYLFYAYQCADYQNAGRLAAAFPELFVNKA